MKLGQLQAIAARAAAKQAGQRAAAKVAADALAVYVAATVAAVDEQAALRNSFLEEAGNELVELAAALEADGADCSAICAQWFGTPASAIDRPPELDTTPFASALRAAVGRVFQERARQDVDAGRRLAEERRAQQAAEREERRAAQAKADVAAAALLAGVQLEREAEEQRLQVARIEAADLRAVRR